MCITGLMARIQLQTGLVLLCRCSEASCDSKGMFYMVVVQKVVAKHDISCAESVIMCRM